MKYFEFGAEHPELMVMPHGGKIDIFYGVSYGTFILMDVLADERLTMPGGALVLSLEVLHPCKENLVAVRQDVRLNLAQV